MFLQNIWLKNFKNYSEAELTFDKDLIVFLGANGSGKTNLLDAIHYLCFCKSYFNPIDSQNVKHGEDFFTVKGTFHKAEEAHEIFCNVIKRKKKTFKRNNKEYDRLSDHIGRFPVVVIAPGDMELVTGGSRGRRRFVDTIMGQYDKPYLDKLIQYNKLIKQRNAQLKEFAETGRYDQSLIKALDKQIIPLGQTIFESRQAFWEDFMPIFHQFYEALSAQQEEVEGEYRSHLQKQSLDQLLEENEMKDRQYTRTTTGPHKDDFKFLINGHALKKYGSQGQKKSFVYALKLTQYHLLRERTGIAPILLLDDVFDRLDHDRVGRLLKIVIQDEFGQIFLTDTQDQRIDEIVAPYTNEFQKIFIEAGKIL